MTDYRRDEDAVVYEKQELANEIRIIQLIFQKRYKEAMKLLVDLC